MKHCEAGKVQEMDINIALTFTTCTYLSLQFCNNDVRAAESPDQRKQERTPEVSIYSELNLDLLSLLIDILDWPSQLPDLSPIGYVFLYEHQVPETSINELTAVQTCQTINREDVCWILLDLSFQLQIICNQMYKYEFKDIISYGISALKTTTVYIFWVVSLYWMNFNNAHT